MVKVAVVIFISCLQTSILYSSNLDTALVWCTVIPRLTKIIRSGITFVSRNTHTDGKDKLLEWPDRSCLLLYVSALIQYNIR